MEPVDKMFGCGKVLPRTRKSKEKQPLKAPIRSPQFSIC